MSSINFYLALSEIENSEDPKIIEKNKAFCIENILVSYENAPRIIFEASDNPLEFIKTLPSEFIEKWKKQITILSLRNGNFSVFEYIVNNYTICLNYNFVYTDDIRIIKILLEKFPAYLSGEICKTFNYNCNLGNIDVLDFLIKSDLLDEKKLAKTFIQENISGYKFINFKSIDVYNTILSKFPNIFENIPDWSINSKNIQIVDMLRRIGYGRKINLYTISKHTDFIRECQYELNLKDFISSREFDIFDHVSDKINFLRLLTVFNEVYDFELLIDFLDFLYSYPRAIDDNGLGEIKKLITTIATKYSSEQAETILNKIV